MIKRSANQVSPGYFIEFEVLPGLVDEAFVVSVYTDSKSVIHMITDDGRDMGFSETDEIWVL